MRLPSGENFGSRLGFHSPEAARAVKAIAIGDEENFGAVGRPRGTDFVIYGAVVVARQVAPRFSREALGVGDLAVAEVGSENVKVLVVGSRDEGDALAVGRKARLEIYGAIGSDLTGFFSLQIEQPQFDRVVGVRRVDDPAAVG